jgi:hypothetical protein
MALDLDIQTIERINDASHVEDRKLALTAACQSLLSALREEHRKNGHLQRENEKLRRELASLHAARS